MYVTLNGPDTEVVLSDQAWQRGIQRMTVDGQTRSQEMIHLFIRICKMFLDEMHL